MLYMLFFAVLTKRRMESYGESMLVVQIDSIRKFPAGPICRLPFAPGSISRYLLRRFAIYAATNR